MTPRRISTTTPAAACDVCGRTLLSGERPDVFVAGGGRHLVCELCVPRAAQEGWVREGTPRAPQARTRNGTRGRSLMGRLRTLRGNGARHEDGQELGVELAGRDLEEAEEDPLGFAALPEPVAAPAPAAVLDHHDMKAVRAVEIFNAGEHPRRVSGVSRSLGTPLVSVRSVAPGASQVHITVAWELSWYRYEVDTATEDPEVQLVSQGTELAELEERERTPNAAADERGELMLV